MATKLEIQVDMQYEFASPPTIILDIEVADEDGQSVIWQDLDLGPQPPRRIEGVDGVGKRVCMALEAPRLAASYKASVAITRADQDLAALREAPLPELPGTALSYLRPSRFCQSDKFPAFVKRRFGDLSGGAKIQSIVDWVAKEMTYLPVSGATTTVMDTFAAREGVCRDYAHMVVALARAANIPARYVAAYGPDVDPPDFHAVAQVWLDGSWHLVDATGMSKATELAVIAVGRDACDIPMLETNVQATMIRQAVSVSRSS